MRKHDDPELLEAWTLHYNGKNDEAIEKFNKILAVKPNYPDALNGLALCQKAVGDPLGARVTFKKLISVLERKLEDDAENAGRYIMEINMARRLMDTLEV